MPNPTPSSGGGGGSGTIGVAGADDGDGAPTMDGTADGAGEASAGGDVGGDVGAGTTGGDGRAVQDTFEPPPDEGGTAVGADGADIGSDDAADTTDTTDDGGADGLLPCEEPVETLNQWDCDLPTPCGEAVLTIDGAGSTGGEEPGVFQDAEAATCITEALRDRTPSALTIGSSDQIGQFTWSETIYVLDDTNALAEGHKQADIDWSAWIKRRQLLQPAEYFTQCLEAADHTTWFECLKGWSQGCGDEPQVCPAP